MGGLNPLPYSAIEVKNIVDLFEQKGLQNNELLLHADAKEQALKKALNQQFRFVHLASHSFANLQSPRFSGIACVQSDTLQEDAILYVNEIYNLAVNSDLVVLSSCESGLGRLVEGEGMLGLNRSFVYAGVNNVLYSLFKVSDKTTSNLMQDFYQTTLFEDESYAAALRSAKLKMLENRVTASPYYWSAFLLVGEMNG